MNTGLLVLRRMWRHTMLPISTAIALSLSVPAAAAPGAHGPGGEHLDAPAHAAGTMSSPRMETKSELFELVASLQGGELAILIDRFETNQPVLGASVEVESGALKAKATFHADLGDYAVDDPALLEALSKPGEHALVFTVIAGEGSDLLEGTLPVEASANEHDADHAHLPASVWVAAGLLGFGAAGFWLWRRRARRGLPVAAIGGRS